MAVAHSIAIFFVLPGPDFRDLGSDYYTQLDKEKKVNFHIKKLNKSGVAIPDEVLNVVHLEYLHN